MKTLDQTMQTVLRILDKLGLERETRAEGSVILTGVRAGGASLRIVIAVRQDPLLVTIIVRMPLVVDEEKRVSVAEALARANYGAAIGRFEMNFADGTLNCIAAIPLADATLTGTQFETVFISTLLGCSTYHRAFGRLLFADDLSPAEAIAEVEMAHKS